MQGSGALGCMSLSSVPKWQSANFVPGHPSMMCLKTSTSYIAPGALCGFETTLLLKCPYMLSEYHPQDHLTFFCTVLSSLPEFHTSFMSEISALAPIHAVFPS